MRWRLEWLIETFMIPIWLISEWVEGWARARAEAKRDLTLSVPGDWEE